MELFVTSSTARMAVRLGWCLSQYSRLLFSWLSWNSCLWSGRGKQWGHCCRKRSWWELFWS